MLSVAFPISLQQFLEQLHQMEGASVFTKIPGFYVCYF